MAQHEAVCAERGRAMRIERIDGLASYLGASRRTIYRLTKLAGFPVLRTASRRGLLLFDLDAVDAWLKQRNAEESR
ncbi:MAG: helix-turn-helix transcriptional regulator [Candidatus Spyradosoma sp.]